MGLYPKIHSFSGVKKTVINYPVILEVVESFYQKATTDFLIGYHFRSIEDFDSHIPRIAAFWELQLTGKTERRHELPFKLLDVHRPLGIKTGELGRWVVLFTETLDTFVKKQAITESEARLWIEKVHFFEQTLRRKLIQPS